jgi:hypothetical protein
MTKLEQVSPTGDTYFMAVPILLEKVIPQVHTSPQVVICIRLNKPLTIIAQDPSYQGTGLDF